MKIGVIFNSTNGYSLIAAAVIARKYPYLTPYDVSAHGYTSIDLAIAAVTNTPDILYSVGVTLSGTQVTNATNACVTFTNLVDTSAYRSPMLAWINLYSTDTPPLLVAMAGVVTPSTLEGEFAAIANLNLTSFVYVLDHPVWQRLVGKFQDLPLVEMISGFTFYNNYV